MLDKMITLTPDEMTEYRRYRRQDGRKCEINGLRWSPANTYEHEERKFRLLFDLVVNQKEKVIIEAIDNKTDKRRDLVSLSTGEIYEVVHSNRDKAVLKKYALDGVNAIFTETEDKKDD